LKAAGLIFPHQLYADHPVLKETRDIFLIEEPLLYLQFPFHRQKLILHRASMKHYEARLKKKGCRVTYLEAQDPAASTPALMSLIREQGFDTVCFADPEDDWLQRKINREALRASLTCVSLDHPGFLNTAAEGHAYFDTQKRYFQTSFYIAQRKKRNILIDANGEPTGGQWSFDDQNRQKMPKGTPVPRIVFPRPDATVKAATAYVEEILPQPLGLASPFLYPVTHESAEEWLDTFLAQRLIHFGTYEDAMVAGELVLFHSVLTPLLNIGLLTPAQVTERTLAYADEHTIPINSLEGFLRQIIGWREFMRMVYRREGRKQRTRNFWGFTQPMPEAFWNGTTGIGPVDEVIRKVLDTGYCHHIERLMVLGSFMLLCEIDPDEVYRWFMMMFVDAYDWVMVPNVYAMSQFADGGGITTKPYLCGSNYILKMSNHTKGPWQKTWDGLFWRFLHLHRDFFRKQPRLSMLLNTFDRMPDSKRAEHLTAAETFLHQIRTSA